MSPSLQPGQGQPIHNCPKLNRYLLSMYLPGAMPGLEIQLWMGQTRACYLPAPPQTQSAELIWGLLGSIHRREVCCSTPHRCTAAPAGPPAGTWTEMRMATFSLSTFWTRQLRPVLCCRTLVFLFVIEPTSLPPIHKACLSYLSITK